MFKYKKPPHFYEGLILPCSTCPISWFPSWTRSITIVSCSKRFSSFRIILLNPHYFTFGRFSTKTKVYLNNLTFIILNISSNILLHSSNLPCVILTSDFLYRQSSTIISFPSIGFISKKFIISS